MSAPGWHGKLPALGDFATRRLAPTFVEAWDGWLADGLRLLQARPGWLDAYLASPSWRFVAMPGALPGALAAQAWAGVLMPSVDRVGRYYPLTLAQPLTALPGDGAALDALLRWLQQLDDAAAQALQDDWSIERLETELARVGPAPAPPDTLAAIVSGEASGGAAPIRVVHPAALREPAAWLAALAAPLLRRQLQGRMLWHAAAGDGPSGLIDSAGLAGPGLVVRLLGTTDADNAS